MTMVTVDMVLKDEIVNVFAMTYGYFDFGLEHQIILCKKTPLEPAVPYILIPKQTLPEFRLSDFGHKYQRFVRRKDFRTEYICYVESNLPIRVDPKLFQELAKEGFFSIWHPEAPLKYFDDQEEGYLALFKVYRIRKPIKDYLLKKARRARITKTYLNKSVDVEVVESVIPDYDFHTLKRNLLALLRENGWLTKSKIKKSKFLAL